MTRNQETIALYQKHLAAMEARYNGAKRLLQDLAIQLERSAQDSEESRLSHPDDAPFLRAFAKPITEFLERDGR